MLLIDVVQDMTRSQRMLCAHRWGVDSSAPMILAERMLVEDTAARLIRRMAKAGASTLGRILVEHVGSPIASHPALEAEASVLRDWGVLLEEGSGWSLPVDLALAARTERRVEHLYLGALITELSAKALRALAESLGVGLAGGQISQRVRLRGAVLSNFDAASASAEVLAGARALQGLGSLPAGTIRSVEPVDGAMGQLFDVTTAETTHRVAPREIALALGVEFPHAEYQAVPLVPMALERVQPLPLTAIGGIIEFQTAQQREQAMHSKRLQAWAMESAGARVLIHAEVDLQAVREELLRIGFESVAMDGAGDFYAS